jgi:hypothetical protein
VAYLDDKLSRLKAQMIQEFTDTKLYREGAMGTVMSLISDTRASLNAQRAKLEGLWESTGDRSGRRPARALENGVSRHNQVNRVEELAREVS